MFFKDKIVWVTGASSGIGRAIVKQLALQDAKIVVSSRKIEDLQLLKESLGSKAGNCYPFTFDLKNTGDIQETVSVVVNKLKKIDYLINVGGKSQRSLIKETPLEIDREIMEINYFGTIALTKAVLPYMLKQGYGHISATSSIVGKFGFPLRSAYAASKHALHGFFETLRAENLDKGIDVSIIIPGRVKTNISLNALTKDGSVHGKLDKGQAEGISSERAAQKILKGIKNSKREILVGGKELLMVHIKRFLPAISSQMVRRIKST